MLLSAPLNLNSPVVPAHSPGTKCQKPMSKKKIKILSIVAVVVVVLLAIIIPQINFGNKNGEDAETTPAGNRQTLQVKAFVAADTLWTEALRITGTILPNEHVEISGETAGRVTSINFEEGEEVKKGDLLIQVNNDEIKARLKRIEAQVQLAQEREQRQKKLLDIGGISQEEYDRSSTEFSSLKAEAEELNASLAKTRIRAPFSGRVGLRYISLGSYISSGTVITSLVDVDPVKLEFTIPEKYSGAVRNGSRINFTIDESDRTFRGEVYAIEPRVDAATRSLRLRAKAQNTTGELVPGRFANIRLVLGEIDNALFIPSHAIVSEMDGQQIFIYRNGKAEKRRVTTGIRTEESVQITEGLDTGDTVITTGLLQVRPGADVTIKEIERRKN